MVAQTNGNAHNGVSRMFNQRIDGAWTISTRTRPWASAVWCVCSSADASQRARTAAPARTWQRYAASRLEQPRTSATEIRIAMRLEPFV